MERGGLSIFDDRRKVLALVHLVTGCTLVFFIAVHLFEQCCYSLSLVQAGAAILMLVNWVRIRNDADLSVIENSLMLGALIVFSALFAFESLEDTGIYWVAGYPFVAYFVHPATKARYWVGAYVAVLIAVDGLVAAGLFELSYSTTQILCLISVVFVFGALAHIYKSQLELRQQQLAEANIRLEQQQKHMQTILDHSPVGIWMVDSNRRFLFVNRVWSEWFGFSEKQARQVEDYTLLIPEALAAKWQASDQACLASDEPYLLRDEVSCTDGVVRTFDAIKVKVSGSSGEVLGIVGFAIDVSDKLRAEEEQRDLERQVQHSQRLESLGVMAGGVAHDFNNLLTAIQGSLELAKLEEGVSESMQESLSCIDSAAHAATELCRQMLTYSGKGVLKTEPINLRDLIEDMHSLFEISVGKQITLDYNFDQTPSVVQGDRSQISQVLLNLVINAAEAIGSDEKQGKISMSLTHRDLDAGNQKLASGFELQSGCYVVMTVEDNGAGMDGDIIEHMFDPFFTTKFTGRGLGLSAIMGILRTHQAGIEVQSTPGVGTSMTIWIPCHRDETLVSEDEKAPKGAPVKGAKVLVVDDEVAVAAVAKRMLEKLGQQVVLASNGREAVEIFSHEEDFDWVLLDVTMPEMDGVECLKALRKVDPAVYVTMSSGYDAENALNGSGDCHPNGFLSKPYSFAALRAVVENAEAARSD
ncbi:PAS domain S-box-containing protein [Mariprofundus aestuarium]|uniref:histidine kinase n=2 Tax=Mariprofundus aestuarium TaxID=1921086 RepID=A0A2K8KVR8_MARES|nr:PAS domain S-box-containing protein [Mariprofundus aestuarium]